MLTCIKRLFTRPTMTDADSEGPAAPDGRHASGPAGLGAAQGSGAFGSPSRAPAPAHPVVRPAAPDDRPLVPGRARGLAAGHGEVPAPLADAGTSSDVVTRYFGLSGVIERAKADRDFASAVRAARETYALLPAFVQATRRAYGHF